MAPSLPLPDFAMFMAPSAAPADQALPPAVLPGGFLELLDGCLEGGELEDRTAGLKHAGGEGKEGDEEAAARAPVPVPHLPVYPPPTVPAAPWPVRGGDRGTETEGAAAAPPPDSGKAGPEAETAAGTAFVAPAVELPLPPNVSASQPQRSGEPSPAPPKATATVAATPAAGEQAMAPVPAPEAHRQPMADAVPGESEPGQEKTEPEPRERERTGMRDDSLPPQPGAGSLSVEVPAQPQARVAVVAPPAAPAAGTAPPGARREKPHGPQTVAPPAGVRVERAGKAAPRLELAFAARVKESPEARAEAAKQPAPVAGRQDAAPLALRDGAPGESVVVAPLAPRRETAGAAFASVGRRLETPAAPSAAARQVLESSPQIRAFTPKTLETGGASPDAPLTAAPARAVLNGPREERAAAAEPRVQPAAPGVSETLPEPVTRPAPAVIVPVPQTEARAASPDPPLQPAPAAPAVLEEPPPAARPSGPARDISLEVAGERGRIAIRVAEREGEIRMAVRTPQADLAGELRERLPELAGRLEPPGWSAEVWRPDPPAAPRADSGAWTDEGREGGAFAGEDGRGGRGQREPRPAWLEEFEKAEERSEPEWPAYRAPWPA